MIVVYNVKVQLLLSFFLHIGFWFSRSIICSKDSFLPTLKCLSILVGNQLTLNVKFYFQILNYVPHLNYASTDVEKSAFRYTGAKSYLRDRILSEVEEKSFIALPEKGVTVG